MGGAGKGRGMGMAPCMWVKVGHGPYKDVSGVGRGLQPHSRAKASQNTPGIMPVVLRYPPLHRWHVLYRFRLGTAGDVGERVVETLRGIAVMLGNLLCQKKGDVGRMVGEIGGTLLAPHMDGGRIREYFGTRRRVGGAEVSEMIARERVPAEIQTGGVGVWKIIRAR